MLSALGKLIAEAVAEKPTGAPVWLTVIALLVGSGGATVAVINVLANRGKNKAETTKTIIDGLTTTLSGYNDSLVKANERVAQANARADVLDEKLRKSEQREAELEARNDRLERDSKDLREQIDKMREEMARLWERVKLCEETHGRTHPPAPPSSQVP